MSLNGCCRCAHDEGHPRFLRTHRAASESSPRTKSSERDCTLAPFPEAATLPPPSLSDAAWTRLESVRLNRKHIAQRRIVTLDRTDRAHFTFDILRTKILKLMRENNWTSVAITSPTAGCGKTVVTTNLAFSFANLNDCRTVLVDLDLRQPQVGRMLGLQQDHSMERFLTGRCSLEDTFVRCGNNLVVSANCHVVSHAAELLQGPGIEPVLLRLRDSLKPNVMLFDLPPMLVSDDVSAFLPHVDCVLLVVAAELSTLREVDMCERTLAEESNLLGVVLNKCQYEPEKYGY